MTSSTSKSAVLDYKKTIAEYDIIKYPISTEKAVRLIELENKLIFVVDQKATKRNIKEALEKMFKAKIIKVNTMITSKTEKRAIVKFSQETPATNIATELGLV